jgi:hypothetical protein
MGIVRTAWPHIRAALERGHTLKTVHARLLEDGLPISYALLASYVSRLRREVSAKDGYRRTASNISEKDSEVSEPNCTTGSQEPPSKPALQAEEIPERARRRLPGFGFEEGITNINKLSKKEDSNLCPA